MISLCFSPQRKTTGGCPICKQLIALCVYHAKVCKENMCPVPFCQNIRQKVKQQQHAQRVQRERLLQRRMANIHVPSRSAAAANSAARPTAYQIQQQQQNQSKSVYLCKCVRLIDLLFGYLIDWLIDWVIDCVWLIDWLIFCFIISLF